MAGRYSSVYFLYLNHNVSVRTGSFLVQSKGSIQSQGQAQSEPRFLKAVSAIFHDTAVCTGQCSCCVLGTRAARSLVIQRECGLP